MGGAEIVSVIIAAIVSASIAFGLSLVVGARLVRRRPADNPRRIVYADEIEVEDLAIIHKAPLRVPVGGKWLVFRAFTWQEYEKYIRWFHRLLLNYNAEMAQVQLLTLPQIQAGEHIDGIEKLFARKPIIKALRQICRQTILRGSGISWRYFRKNVTRDALIQIFYALRVYNIDSVKKNVQQTMAALGLTSDTADTSPPWRKSTGGQRTSTVVPLYPQYASWLAGQPNEPQVLPIEPDVAEKAVNDG